MSFSSIVIPTDYAWGAWTLSGVTNSTTYLSLTVGQDAGTATSPSAGYDLTSGYEFMKPDWRVENDYGLSFEARTADTSAGLTSADWFDLRDDCMIPLAYRKRFVQFRATFARNSDSSSPTLFSLTIYYNYDQPKTDTNGFNYSGKGSLPSKDGKLKGRLYQCAVTGFWFRRQEMVWQRGKLVSRKLAWDQPQNQYLC